MTDTLDNTSLEELLKTVNYKALEVDYIPTKFALKFINFIKLVNGENKEENTSPLFHYKMLDTIITHRYNLIVAFRGSAKTTLLEYLILYIATFGELDHFGKITLALYISDTMENGAKNFRNNLEFRYDNSEFLKQFIPVAKFTDAKIMFENAEGHVFVIKLYGAATGVRGVKEQGVRPQLALFDDLLSDKNATSPTIMGTISDVIYNAVMAALHPTKKKIVWIGTPFNKKDPLYQAAGNPYWNTQVFPICQKFPCSKQEFIGAWEDRFNKKTVTELYDLLKSNGRIDAFNQEYMLRILSTDDRLVLDEDILWYNRQDVLNNIHKYNIYITTDFATSEKEKADYSVISVWALSSKGVFHWIDGIVKRQDMAKNVDDIFRFTKMYNTLLVGVEVSGQQKGFVSWLKRDMLVRGQFFTLASDKTTQEEGLRPNTSKLTRFNVALPLFKQRKIAFPLDLKDSDILTEFLDELTCITPSGIKSIHDDCVDTVSQLPLLNYFIPSDNVEPVNNIEERDDYFNPFYYHQDKESGSSYFV